MTAGMIEEKLIGRREGQVGHLIFNNPAKHNAISMDMADTSLGWPARPCIARRDIQRRT